MRTACGIRIETIDLHIQVIATIVRDQIDAMLAAAPGGLSERFAWLLRYVDTKRLIGRLRAALSLNAGANHWQLAVAMKAKQQKPAELKTYLDTIDRLAA